MCISCVCALKVNECITHTRLKLDFIEKNSMVFVLAEVTNDPSVQLRTCMETLALQCALTQAQTHAHAHMCEYVCMRIRLKTQQQARESTYMRKQLLYIAMLFFCRCFVVSLLLLLPVSLLLLPPLL